MPGRLQGKRALITAAGQGIGRASAEAFAFHERDAVVDGRFASIANLGGAEFRVNTQTVGEQFYSAVAGLSDGGFVVSGAGDRPR